MKTKIYNFILVKILKAKMPNGEGKYIINSNKDMMFVFEQYQKVGEQNIQMYIEFIQANTKLIPVLPPPNT